MPDETQKASPDAEAVAAYVRHEWVNQEAPRLLLREIADKRLCELLGVRYDPHGETHVQLLQGYWAFIVQLKAAEDKEIAEVAQRRADRAASRRATFATMKDRTVSVMTGIVIATGLAWLASKLHIKIPGLPE